MHAYMSVDIVTSWQGIGSRQIFRMPIVGLGIGDAGGGGRSQYVIGNPCDHWKSRWDLMEINLDRFIFILFSYFVSGYII